MKTNKRSTLILVESAVMIALASVLSLVKFVDMPYGGSVTLASMLPMVIIAYRHGVGVGFGAGFVYAVIQQLLGLNTLSYVTGWQSIVAVIMLDYILAFVSVGLGGIFRKVYTSNTSKSQATGLALGMLIVCVVRYVMHVISGATVWAGLSIPSEAALIYSLGYNATYMIPEAIVNTAVAAYIGGIIDLSKNPPVTYRRGEDEKVSVSPVYRRIGVGALILGGIVSICEIFLHLQNEESGEFTFAFLGEVDWVLVAIVLVLSVAVFAVTEIMRREALKQKEVK